MTTKFPPSALERINKHIEASAMCDWLQISARLENADICYQLTFNEEHIGNPVIRAIHGGVVSTFLETSAWLTTLALIDTDETLIQTTSVHTTFLRSSKAEDMYGSVTVHRLGRRYGFVNAFAWQKDAEKPVAFSEIGLRIIRTDEKEL